MEDINLGPVRTWPIFVYFAKIFVIRSVVQVITVSIFISKFCQAVQTFKNAVLPLVPYALGWKDLFGSAKISTILVSSKFWIC